MSDDYIKVMQAQRMKQRRERESVKSRSKKKPTTEPIGSSVKERDSISYEIKRAREKRDLTISDLSRLTGISRTVLFGYEGGRTRPGAREIRLIAQALRVSPNRLIFGDEKPFEPKSGLAPLVELIASNPTNAVVTSVLLIPIVGAVLTKEEWTAILSIVGSLVEARDKKAFAVLTAMTEVMSEFTGNPAGLAQMSELQNDPAKMAEMQEKVNRRIKELQGGE